MIGDGTVQCYRSRDTSVSDILLGKALISAEVLLGIFHKFPSSGELGNVLGL